jgi:hypothetical protein
MTNIPATGTPMRCVDARVRKVAAGAVTSDFEKAHAGIIEVMEVLTVREVLQHRPFGNAWAVRFVEIERGIEGIRRYRAKKVYDIDRPFLLDRFVIVRGDDDGDDAPAPRPREPIEA